VEHVFAMILKLQMDLNVVKLMSVLKIVLEHIVLKVKKVVYMEQVLRNMMLMMEQMTVAFVMVKVYVRVIWFRVNVRMESLM
jgi:hypothetical protein